MDTEFFTKIIFQNIFTQLMRSAQPYTKMVWAN